MSQSDNCSVFSKNFMRSSECGPSQEERSNKEYDPEIKDFLSQYDNYRRKKNNILPLEGYLNKEILKTKDQIKEFESDRRVPESLLEAIKRKYNYLRHFQEELVEKRINGKEIKSKMIQDLRKKNSQTPNKPKNKSLIQVPKREKSI